MHKYQTSFIANSKVTILSDKGKKHVAVVGGGMSAEREVSLVSSSGVNQALVDSGYKVTFIDMGVDIASVLLQIKPDIVYNCLHGTYGEDGCLPGLLNILRIPYTHSGVLASSLAFSKIHAKAWFVANDIKTAKSIIVNKSDNIKDDPMPRPYVIKPLIQGSSIGVEVIFVEDDFNFADYDFPYGDQVMIEEYIKGREMQVAVLNGRSLGVLEIKLLKRRFYDYETKYTDGFAEHLCPAPLPQNMYNKLLEESERIYQTMNCRGVVRTEFIFDESKNEFFALEINTHPGMTPLSIIPEIAALQGMDFRTLVERILETACIDT
ncbi:MAG: D-alanine--D-alanine ligase [Rickettsia endosymbiont of Sergentomyia squamirostris]|uniref:D-alanine--D-alanine ligase n=1 Tax=Candidatus Tisiphia endosymbiont of Sergentomyia squamirostris TaxID=3113639 RepID=A0AAT9G7Y2_9RICK